MVAFALYVVLALLCVSLGTRQALVCQRWPWLRSLARWMFLLFPFLLVALPLSRMSGNPLWHQVIEPWTLPVVGYSLLIAYFVGVTGWGILKRARVAQEESRILENSRPVLGLAHDSRFRYRTICDQVGIRTPPPLLANPNIPTTFVSNWPKSYIVFPAEIVPLEFLGESAYWGERDPSREVTLETLQAITAHELSHLANGDGLQGFLREIHGLLLPWSWIRSTYHAKPAATGIAFSRRIGQQFGSMLYADTLRELIHLSEDQADQRTQEILKRGRNIIESFRGREGSPATAISYEASGSPVKAVAGVVLACGVTAGFTWTAPGRMELRHLLGHRTPLPWSLPAGWRIYEAQNASPNKPVTKVKFYGRFPGKQGQPGSVLIDIPPKRVPKELPAAFNSISHVAWGGLSPSSRIVTRLRFRYSGPEDLVNRKRWVWGPTYGNYAGELNPGLIHQAFGDGPSRIIKLTGDLYEMEGDQPVPPGISSVSAVFYWFRLAAPGTWEIFAPSFELVRADGTHHPLGAS